jgi:hypothetical protein
MKKSIIAFQFIVLAVCFCISLVSCFKPADIEAENKARGTIIINALYKYQQDHDNFPSTLNDLVPDYLDSVPKTNGGDRFFYNTNSIDGFLLGFSVKPKFGCGYTDQSKKWECGFGD